ncbi:hypothetical protein GOBAR_DD26850 [Gossypium barbadense]|nr:hypothetical protein GOBAR_DD26850 [Gossypium barbadense]
MDRPPSTCGLPIIFMLDHLLLEDDEVLKRLMNSRLAQHGRLGPMYLNIERQVSFWMFPSGARFNVLGFSSENGLNNVAMMGYAFDPNKNYVFVIGKLSGVNFVVSSLKILQCLLSARYFSTEFEMGILDDEGPRMRAEAIAERICQVLERNSNI